MSENGCSAFKGEDGYTTMRAAFEAGFDLGAGTHRPIAQQAEARAEEAERLLKEFLAAMDMHLGSAHEEAICDVEDKARAFLERTP